MTTRRSFLHLSLGAAAATTAAVTLPHVAHAKAATSSDLQAFIAS